MVLTILCLIFLILWFISLFPAPAPLGAYNGWFAWLTVACLFIKVVGTAFLH